MTTTDPDIGGDVNALCIPLDKYLGWYFAMLFAMRLGICFGLRFAMNSCGEQRIRNEQTLPSHLDEQPLLMVQIQHPRSIHLDINQVFSKLGWESG
jgi:hypothetical protein